MNTTTDKIAELERQNEELRRALQEVRALAEKWHKDAIDTGFALSEPAEELFDVLDADRSPAANAGGEVPEEVLHAVERMCKPLHESRLSGITAQEDARCMKVIADFIGLLGNRPTATAAGDLPDVREMVDRFLGWPLPKDFSPDCGISFDGRKDDEWNKNKTWPIGTNLLSADQAKAMFEYCLRPTAISADGQKGGDK